MTGRGGAEELTCAASAEGAEGARVVVRSLKYDGRVQRSWPATLVRREGPLVVVEGVFDREVSHAHLGLIEAGTRSVEFFWTDRFYSVFRFEHPRGGLRNFYCNVNTPAALDGGVLSFVDLDVDVLVAPDFSYVVLDEDEYEAHAALFDYPEETRRSARRALRELISRVERREFPFDDGAQT